MNLVATTDTAYRFDTGQEFVRVTSALSLVRADLRTIPLEVLHHASERGKAVHRAAWILAGGDPSGLHWPSVHEEVRPYVEGFQAFQRETGCQFIEQERLVVSQRFWYAGRLDLLGRWKDAHGIIDLKTGEPHATHRLQASAYLEAFVEETKTRKRLRRWILYLLPSGRYRVVDCDEVCGHHGDFFVFTQILGVYRWLQGNGGKDT